jgi:hypothetical protein
MFVYLIEKRDNDDLCFFALETVDCSYSEQITEFLYF